jgi:hypothetical protein
MMWTWPSINILVDCCQRKGSRRNLESLSEQKHPQISPFFNLPAELKQRITDYLPAPDALRLRRVSKSVCSDLSLTVRPAFRILQKQQWAGDSSGKSNPRMATWIPVFGGSKTHSITLQCQWRSLENHWGDSMSRICIVAHRPDDDELSMSAGTVVVERSLSSISASNLGLSFRPKSEEIYSLWYVVGGGSKNWLLIGDVHIHALVVSI